MARQQRPAARNKPPAGEGSGHGIWALNPTIVGLWLGCISLNSYPLAPTMTESSAPAAFIGLGAPGRPDGSQSCWPQAFRSAFTRDTFAEDSLLLPVRRAPTPAAAAAAATGSAYASLDGAAAEA